MPENPYHYTVEKLTNVIDVLATHPGDARERVACEFWSCHMLREDDFPKKHRRKWMRFRQEIGKYSPVVLPEGVFLPGTGAIDVWARTVRKSTGAKMAKLLWELYWSVTQNTQFK
ncbi:MAG: hypothetical protein IT461_16605 [Planctomycetes bacterium]|nr:hypothetical protein [Planctomycetota bacterium]